jgi:hypothetical protein
VAAADVASAVAEASIPPGEASELENPGQLYIAQLIDPISGAPVGSGFISCVGADEGEPAAPANPPSAADIWRSTDLFTPDVILDPVIRGLTGLETFMWYEGTMGETLEVGPLNGYAVTATIEPARFIWDMGDGVQIVSTTPGSAAEPAGTHVYTAPGVKPITHTVVWTGSAVITGPGLPGGGVTIDLGSAPLIVARDYDVIEVRTPVVGGNTRPSE